MHRAMGFVHATVHHDLRHLRARLADQPGQGTVEYVGLLLLIGGVIAAAVSIKGDANIPTTIVNKLREAIDAPGGK